MEKTMRRVWTLSACLYIKGLCFMLVSGEDVENLTLCMPAMTEFRSS